MTCSDAKVPCSLVQCVHPFQRWCVSVLALLLIAALSPRVAGDLTFQSATIPDHQVSYPFNDLVISNVNNDAIPGMTVMVLFSSCDQGSKFFFSEDRPLLGTFQAEFDDFTCSLFVRPAAPVATWPIEDFNFVLRRVAFARTVANSVSGAELRAGWLYWIGDSQRVVSMHRAAMYCPLPPMPVATWNGAAEACGQWVPREGSSKTTPSTVSCPTTQELARLTDYLRRRGGRQPNTGSGPVTSSLRGYLLWTGQYGTSPLFSNGGTVGRYQPFGRDEPRGQAPSVMADDNKWYTALPLENSLPYCCQSTLTSDYEVARVGRVTFVAGAAAAAWSIPSVDMPTDAGAFPFLTATLELTRGTRGAIYGATATVHVEDCSRAAVRWVVSAVDSTTTNVTNNVLMCSATLIPSTAGAMWTVADAISALESLQLITVSDTVQPAPSQRGTRVRVAYSYLTVPSTMPIVHPPAGDPSMEGPHAYQCFFDPRQWRDAAAHCRLWGGELGYLATPQSTWEQRIVERLRGSAARTDDVWIGLNTWFTSIGSGTFKMSNGDLTNFTNWAPNEPQLDDAPVVMSAQDGRWRGVFNEYSSNYSYCCEATAILERRNAGRLNVVPVGALPASVVSERRSYSEENEFAVFKTLSSDVHGAGAAVSAWGMTTSVDEDRCARMPTNITWSWRSDSSVPSGYITCPPLEGTVHSPSQQRLCPVASHTVLRARCMTFVIREDGALVPTRTWLDDIAPLLVLKLVDVLTHPMDEVHVAWTLWHRSGSAFPFVNASSGEVHWCGQGRSTFEEAAARCVDWAGDAYLTTISSVEEEELVHAARRATTDFASNVPNIWLGHERRDTTFLTGLPLTFTRWTEGQPDGSGPTLLTGLSSWTNVQEFSFLQQATAGVCCKRGLRAVSGVRGPATGLVIVSGRTLSRSLTGGTDSASHSAAKTLSRQLTTPVIIRTPTESESHPESVSPSLELTETRNIGASVTPEISLSTSNSLEASPSTSRSLTAVNRGRVEIRLVEPGEVDGDAIRGLLPEKDRPELRRAHFEIRNNWFRGGAPGAELRRHIRMQQRIDTFFGFSTLRDVLITDSSFFANSTHLTIEFQKSDKYDVTENEVIFVYISRGVTYMDELDLPLEFEEPYEIVILHGGEPTLLADVAITIANAFAVVGSQSAFKDQQVMAMIGAMTCARGAQRTVFRATGRIISPLKFGNMLFSQWLGSFVPSYGFVWLHVAVVLFMLRDVRHLRPRKVARRVAKVFFPSVSLLIVSLLHIGVIFYSLELFKVLDGPGWEFAAVWSLLYEATALGLVIFWSVADTALFFKNYTPAEFSQVPPMLGFIIPFGYWGPDSAQRMTRFVIGDFHRKRFAGFEYVIGAFVASIAAWRPDDIDTCVIQYWIMSVFFIVCSIVLIILRPFRSRWSNAAAALSNVLLSATMVCATFIVREPYGAAHWATNTVRWMMTGLSGLRGLIGIAVLYLEWKLVEQRRKQFEAEAKRIKEKAAIQDALGDDPLLGGGTSKSERRARQKNEALGAATGAAQSPPRPLLPMGSPDAATSGGASPSGRQPTNPIDRTLPTAIDGGGLASPLLARGGGAGSALRQQQQQPPAAAGGGPTRTTASTDDHTVIASLLNASQNSNIYRPVGPQANEIDRRQRLQRLLDSTGPSANAGLLTPLDRGEASSPRRSVEL